MKKATAIPAIDRNHPRKDKTCSIYIRVTHQRKKKEYPTGISMLPDDYDRIMKSQKAKRDEMKVYSKILSFHSKALSVINSLPVFTFNLFESLYLSNSEAADTIQSGFEKHISELYGQNQIGTAVSYQTALNSIQGFKSGLRYADITPDLLRRYEKYMLDLGRSITTVGIYLRCLRTIMNRADIDKKLYPFGQGRNKFVIPEGRNIKKALPLDVIKRIYNLNLQERPKLERARDYWIFIYLCNGMNVKDLCLLRYKNISDTFLMYTRSKTARSKRVAEEIKVSLKPEAKAIICKWGVPMQDLDTFIFPHLNNSMSLIKQRSVYQELTKQINKHMKKISAELGLENKVTTYAARHSYATVLKNSGATTEFISEALGHSDVKTTKDYLDSFEDETIHKVTDALRAAF